MRGGEHDSSSFSLCPLLTPSAPPLIPARNSNAFTGAREEEGGADIQDLPCCSLGRTAEISNQFHTWFQRRPVTEKNCSHPPHSFSFSFFLASCVFCSEGIGTCPRKKPRRRPALLLPFQFQTAHDGERERVGPGIQKREQVCTDVRWESGAGMRPANCEEKPEKRRKKREEKKKKGASIQYSKETRAQKVCKESPWRRPGSKEEVKSVSKRSSRGEKEPLVAEEQSLQEEQAEG